MNHTMPIPFRTMGAQAGPRMNQIARHPMLWLVGIMFALTWPVLIAQALASQGILPFTLPTPVEFAAGWAPAVAAIIVTGAMYGRAGVKQLLGRFLIVRVNILWYLAGLFGIAAFVLGGIGLYAALGNPMPHIPAVGVPLTTAAFALVVTVLLGMVFNTEEIAWRGVMLPYLQARNGALVASLLIAVPEFMLHLPYFFNKQIAFYQNAGFLAFAAFTLAEAILITWMFNNTRGSLLIVTLGHASQNAWANLLSDNQPGPFYLTVILLALAAAVVVVIYGPARLSRQGQRADTQGMSTPATEATAQNARSR